MLEFFTLIFSNFWPWLGFTIVLLGGLELLGKIIITACYYKAGGEE